MPDQTYVISVRAEIVVNPAAWQAEYGTSGDAEDVEDYILNQINSSPAAESGCMTLTGFAVAIAP